MEGLYFPQQNLCFTIIHIRSLCLTSVLVKGVGMLWGALLRLGLQDCAIKVVSPHQCVYEVEITRDATTDLCRSSKIFMDAFSGFDRGNVLCPDKTSGSLDYLIFIWEKNWVPFTEASKWWQICSAEVSDSRSYLQAKGEVDAVCPVHRARQQDFKQCPHPEQKAVGCAGGKHWCVSGHYQLLSAWQC